MSLMTVLLGIHIVITLMMIGFILLQKSGSDGFGLGSGSGANFMSGRQSANFMTRGTAILATLFMVNSLFLSILASDQGQSSILDTVPTAEDGLAPIMDDVGEVETAPSEPAVPLAE